MELSNNGPLRIDALLLCLICTVTKNLNTVEFGKFGQCFLNCATAVAGLTES